MEKKIFIFSVVFVFIIVAGYLILVKIFAFRGWDMVVDKGQEIKISSLGDKFIIKHKTISWLDIFTTVDVIEYETKHKVASYSIEGDFYSSDLQMIINLDEIRCYVIYDLLIYKVGESQFDGVTIYIIEYLKPEDHPSLVRVAKVLVETKKWEWIKAFGIFLLRTGDENIRKMLERYAEGQFYKYELELNKNSKYTGYAMQFYAKQALNKD